MNKQLKTYNTHRYDITLVSSPSLYNSLPRLSLPIHTIISYHLIVQTTTTYTACAFRLREMTLVLFITSIINAYTAMLAHVLDQSLKIIKKAEDILIVVSACINMPVQVSVLCA